MTILIDIHSHIIPQIDDGSESLESSINMLKEAINSGVTDIIATPHYCPNRNYINSIDQINEKYNLLKQEAEKQNLPINIYLGEEIYSSDYDNIVKKLDEGELLTLNGTRFVLIEFSQQKMPNNIFEVIYDLSVHGYKPIIAHVERYKWITVDIVNKMREENAYIQINASSLSRISTKRFCKKLIKNDLVDFIASDIHSGRKNCYCNFDCYIDDRLLDDIMNKR